MQLFLRHVGEYLRTFPQIRLTRGDEVLFRESIMSHLGLKNMNQLRDRFEGQAFLDKTIKNLGGLMACQKYLNLDLVDLENINLSDFHPKLQVNNEFINIHVFDFGTLPLLNSKSIRTSIFFVLKKDNLTYSLCGYANPDVIKENLIKANVEMTSRNENMHFTGFSHLRHIDVLVSNN